MQATILKARADADLLEAGIKQGDTFYMVRDGLDNGPNMRFRVVKWEHTRWVCSCGKGRCKHKILVNDFLFQASQQHWAAKRQVPHDDLRAYVEDEQGTNH
jgi:hypothetical protein